MDRYRGCIGEFLVTVKLNGKVAREIDRLFNATLSARDVEVGKLSELFNRRESATVVVERGTNNAKRAKKQFVEFFGN